VAAPLIINPPPGFPIDAASVLADNLRAEFLASDQRLRATTAASITIPGDLPAGKYVKGWTCDVRGSIIKPKNARALLVMVLGGTTKEIEFPWGKEFGPDKSPFPVRFKAREPRLATMMPLGLSVLLVIQRQSTQDTVLLAVDSLDVVADVM
jgi:hypothetical protein